MKKLIKKQIDYTKWLFRKPMISFEGNKPDITQMVRDKNFYELRQYLPEFIVGNFRFSRLQSLGMIGVITFLGTYAGFLLHHPILLAIGAITLSFNSLYQVNSNGNDAGACFLLDSTHFIMTYAVSSTTYAIIGIISGTTITWGTPTATPTSSGGDWSPSGCLLDSTHFVINYTDGSGNLMSTVGVISGTNITFGSAYSLGFTGQISQWCFKVDSTHFVVGLVNGSNSYSYVTLGVVSSGTVITMHQSSNIGVQYFPYSAFLLDSTHFVLTYQNGSNLASVICTISGTSISLGTPTTVAAISEGDMIASATSCLLDSTHFVVNYKSANNQISSVIGTISGSSITFGSITNFVPTGTGNVAGIRSCFSINSSNFVLAYQDNNWCVSCIGGVVSGGSVTFGAVAKPSANFDSQYAQSCLLNSTQFILAYDYSNNNAYAVIGGISIPAAPNGNFLAFM